MDLNLVVLSGRLAAPPEIRTFDSGTRMIRYLVTTRSGISSSRVDVVPVAHWDPEEESDADAMPGTRVWVAGTAQRRFWEGEFGRRSRLEIVADQVCLQPPFHEPGPH